MSESETPLLPARGKTSGKVLLESSPAPADIINRPKDMKSGRSLEDQQLVDAGKKPKYDSRTADEAVDGDNIIEGEFTESDDTKTEGTPTIGIPEAIVIGEVVTEAGKKIYEEVTRDKDKDRNSRPEPEPESRKPKEKEKKKEKEVPNSFIEVQKELKKLIIKKADTEWEDKLVEKQDELVAEAENLKVFGGIRGRVQKVFEDNDYPRAMEEVKRMATADQIHREIDGSRIEESLRKDHHEMVREYCLVAELVAQYSLKVASGQEDPRLLREISLRGWGTIPFAEQEAKAREYLESLRNSQPKQPVDGQADLLKGLFGSGHTLESYEKTGDTRGIFNDEQGHGLYRIFPSPIVTRKAETPMESSGTWDMFIELNKFSQGRGDIALWGKLLEYALPGEDNEGNRWGMLEIAKFINSVYNISKSADYKKLIDKEKGLLNGIDPRAIAIIIKQVPEMSAGFAYYWEKFRDSSLITNAQDIITEVSLRDEDVTKAVEWGCSEGILRATRHWVTEFGVFPFTQSETRKMVNRYPGMFIEPNGTLVPGIGFSLVEIQGERKGSIMDRALGERNYEKFLQIYSDTSYAGNTDPLWSIKMWSGVDVIHDFIANTYKHALKTMNESINPIASVTGITPSGFEHLVNQGFLTKKPVKIPSFGKFVSTIEGSRALLVSNVKFMLEYLFNLEPVDPNIPTGPVRSKRHLFLFGNHENEIVQALGECLVRNKRGLDGPVSK